MELPKFFINFAAVKKPTALPSVISNIETHLQPQNNLYSYD